VIIFQANGESGGSFWDSIVSFFNMIRESINNFIQGIWSIDNFVISFYAEHIAPLDELVKLALFILFSIIVLLGVISLIKKSLKLVITIALIVIAVILLNQI